MLIALNIVAVGWIVRLEIRLARLSRGKSISIEETLALLWKGQKELERFRGELESYLEVLEKRVRRSIQAVRLSRFSPFPGRGEGGNQSFATALLNEEKSGAVLSTLYVRNQVSVFGKPITKGSSPFELSEEEKGVLKEATEALDTKR